MAALVTIVAGTMAISKKEEVPSVTVGEENNAISFIKNGRSDIVIPVTNDDERPLRYRIELRTDIGQLFGEPKLGKYYYEGFDSETTHLSGRASNIHSLVIDSDPDYASEYSFLHCRTRLLFAGENSRR